MDEAPFAHGISPMDAWLQFSQPVGKCQTRTHAGAVVSGHLINLIERAVDRFLGPLPKVGVGKVPDAVLVSWEVLGQFGNIAHADHVGLARQDEQMQIIRDGMNLSRQKTQQYQ